MCENSIDSEADLLFQNVQRSDRSNPKDINKNQPMSFDVTDETTMRNIP